MYTRECLVCGEVFTKKPYTSRADWEKRYRFCGKSCWYKNKSVEMQGNKIASGHNPWNKGLEMSNDHKKKLSDIRKAKPVRHWLGKERRHMWINGKLGYFGLHKWVIATLGQPGTCEFCGKSGLKAQQINWANKDHLYKKNIDDWIRLCVRCHRSYDKKFKKQP